MHIDGYVERLRTDLVAAASSGGEEMIAAAERLATSLDAAVRMALLEALADATAEITAELDGPAVELRLRGRNPEFAVSLPPATTSTVPAASAADDTDDDGATARITLRLSEPLKQRLEQAASNARQSANTWLVDAIREATRDPDTRHQRTEPGRRVTGWVR